MERFSNKIYKIALIGVILLGVFFRLYDLNNNPISLGQDEAVAGYDAFSILNTLKDHHGNFLPLNFESFGDWVPPVLTYSTVPVIGIFGLSEGSIRLVTALYGIGAILLALVIAKQLEFNRFAKLFLISSVSLAPVLITHSRIAIPPSIVPFFVLLSIVILIQILKDIQNGKVKIWLLIVAGLSLALEFMIYPTQKVFAPIMLIIFALTILLSGKLNRKLFFKLLIIPSVLIVLVTGNFYPFLKEGERYNFRFSEVSLTTRYTGVELVKQAAGRYLQYFGPNYLILKGDQNKLQHVPNTSLISYPVVIFFYIGLLLISLKILRSVIKKEKVDPIYLFILLTTLSAPLVASLTRDNYHTLRVMHFLTLIPIISALGIKEIFILFKGEIGKKLAPTLVIISVIFSIIYSMFFFQYYINDYREISKGHFQYGVKELVYLASKIENKRIIFDTNSINMPYIYYLFFNKVVPTDEIVCDINNCKVDKERPIGWVSVEKIGDVEFKDTSKEDCEKDICLKL